MISRKNKNLVLNNDSTLKKDWKIYCGLVLVFLVFCVGLKNNFVVWDDPRYVYENELIVNPTFENLIRIFKSVVLLNYHPITMITYWLNSFLFGMKPFSFILVNILIHVVNVSLIYKFVLKLNINNSIALFTAIIWGIHPMHVESVVWISERKDLLYTTFFLLGLINYTQFLNKENNQLKASYIFFLLACLSKPMAIVFPLVLILIDFWFQKKINLGTFLDKKVFFLISILFLILSVNLLNSSDFFGVLEKIGTSKSVIENNFSFLERISLASFSLIVYFLKAIIPIQLHHWYVYPQLDAYIFASCLFPILIGLILIKSKSKIVQFGLYFFIINIILVLQILPNSIAMMAERYTYLSYFGLILIMVTYLINQFSQNISNAVLGLIIISFAFLSFKQIQNWKNTKTMWENTFQYHPENQKIATTLLNIYKEEQNDLAIKTTCQKAINAGLKDKTIYFEIAQLNIKNQEYKDAILNLNLAQNASSDIVFNHIIDMNKAAVYGWLGQADSSAFYIQKFQNSK